VFSLVCFGLSTARAHAAPYDDLLGNALCISCRHAPHVVPATSGFGSGSLSTSTASCRITAAFRADRPRALPVAAAAAARVHLHRGRYTGRTSDTIHDFLARPAH